VTIAELLPGPRSMVRRRISDPRALLGAGGYALTLQVSHPSIAGGVRDHSTYATDPWGRAFRTADYLFLLSYGDAATVARLVDDLRAAHRKIRGVDHHGHRYSGLDPEAYAWVHATIGDAIVRGHAFLGTTFTPAQKEEFWAEWLDLGTVLGVRGLPETWSGLRAYVREMIADVLEDNDVVQQLHDTSRFALGGSPFGWLPASVWGLVGVPAGPAMAFIGTGMLPALLRRRFGLAWSPAHQAAFAALCGASKASTPVLPRVVRQSGPLNLWLRRDEVGPFGRKRAG
jgi:uncharacterized protein (DUF2236 family)